ncbi:MAG: ribonuclease T [Gammaproteobacteria bacterium]
MHKPLHQRFRGYLPVVIDVETAGFNARTDALLELAAISVHYNDEGILAPQHEWHYHIKPFEGANLDPKALEFNGIVPDHPFRLALTETDALVDMFVKIEEALDETKCQRAILVGHNAAFDLSFLQAAVARTGIKKSPFHAFSCLDTASLAAVAYGQTVLAKALRAANIPFDLSRAHSALYDADRTALLFCDIVNRWDRLDK